MNSIAATLLSASFCLLLTSVVTADDPVAYGNYENLSTANPSEHLHHHMAGDLKPMFVPHGSGDEEGIHPESMVHTGPLEVEAGTEHSLMASSSPKNESIDPASTDSINMSSPGSSEMGDTNSTEQGPSTRPTYIMVIPRKNMTTSQPDNSTDSSMEEEASAATSEQGTHGKAAGSSASALVVLALATLSSRAMLSQ